MRRTLLAAARIGAALLVIVVLAGWMLRFRIASTVVDRTFAAAKVPASYRITRLSPSLERIEDVRIGDPALPDLVARRIDIAIGYGLAGPVVRGVSADGVRLRARIDGQGLHLGALDRLLPSAGGRTELPDLDLALRDTVVALATPNGAIQARLIGSGNPARHFAGQARVSAPALRLGSCALEGVAADMRVAVAGGAPTIAGPVRIGETACGRLILARGAAQIAASSGRALDRLALRAALIGFAGQAASARFSALGGRVAAAGTFGDLTARAQLRLADLSLNDAARKVAASGMSLAGTPIGPTARRATAGLARLLHRGDAAVDLDVALYGSRIGVQVRRAGLIGSDGARLAAEARGGISWSAAGWRVDADVAASGGSLPTIAAGLRQTAVGAPLTGTGRLVPYTAGEARLAATVRSAAWNGRTLSFDMILSIDGPIGGGGVRGLIVPLAGQATSSGALVLGEGCQTVAFHVLRLGSFRFDPAHLPVCGRPILAYLPSHGARLDADLGAVRLTGHMTAGGPVALRAGRLRLTEQGFSADAVEATLGEGAAPTHITVATLDGRFGPDTGGRFAGAAGTIANVPLDLAEAGGRWTFADGRLMLGGGLRVSDAAASPRFKPLRADNATLRLDGGVITADADLAEPRTHIVVGKLSLAHDLATGSGHAAIDVPGIGFTPKGLQPDDLTPLTLGVVANVDGIVSGGGRIAWSAHDLTSGGMFGTERIDLAAAFGPVTGISGRIRFTDLLGLVSAPHQEATIAQINPGIVVPDGVVHFQLIGASRVRIDDATWPFAAGTLRLLPTTLDFGADAKRHLPFRVDGIDAARFIQQLDFPNIAATGTFDGTLPMVFDQDGGRIESGIIAARSGGGTLAYVGELSTARIGTMGKLAFDALKAIRYSALDISLNGKLDGEMVSQVRFTGIREATPARSLAARLIRNLPFRFNIVIRAPFRGLVGSARSYMDPRLLLNQATPPVQPPDIGIRR